MISKFLKDENQIKKITRSKTKIHYSQKKKQNSLILREQKYIQSIYYLLVKFYHFYSFKWIDFPPIFLPIIHLRLDSLVIHCYCCCFDYVNSWSISLCSCSKCHTRMEGSRRLVINRLSSLLGNHHLLSLLCTLHFLQLAILEVVIFLKFQQSEILDMEMLNRCGCYISDYIPSWAPNEKIYIHSGWVLSFQRWWVWSIEEVRWMHERQGTFYILALKYNNYSL